MRTLCAPASSSASGARSTTGLSGLVGTARVSFALRQLARLAFEALTDDPDDLRRRRHRVVAEPVQQGCEPKPLGRSHGGDLGAATWRQQRLQDPLVVRVRSELDESCSSGGMRELAGRLLTNAERPPEIGDRQAVLRGRDRGKHPPKAVGAKNALPVRVARLIDASRRIRDFDDELLLRDASAVKRWEAFASGCRRIGGHWIPWRVVASRASRGTWSSGPLAELRSAGGAQVRCRTPAHHTTRRGTDRSPVDSGQIDRKRADRCDIDRGPADRWGGYLQIAGLPDAKNSCGAVAVTRHLRARST